MNDITLANTLIDKHYSSGVFGFFDSMKPLQLAADAVQYANTGRPGVTYQVLSQMQKRGFASSNIVQVARGILDKIPQATLNNLALRPDGFQLVKLLETVLKASSPENKNAPRSVKIAAAIAAAKPPEKKKPLAGTYYTIDSGIVLNPTAIGYLDKIGAEYFEKTGKKFNVNSGTRTPLRQADAMYTVIQSGDTTLSLYNRATVTPILNAYKTAKAAGQSRQQIVQAMADVIQDQVNRKIYISNHLKAGGIDISVVGDAGVPAMSEPEKKIMIAIAKKVTGGNAFEERRPPHIHIQYQ